MGRRDTFVVTDEFVTVAEKLVGFDKLSSQNITDAQTKLAGFETKLKEARDINKTLEKQLNETKMKNLLYNRKSSSDISRKYRLRHYFLLSRTTFLSRLCYAVHLFSCPR